MKFVQKHDDILNCEVIEVLDADGDSVGQIQQGLDGFSFWGLHTNQMYPHELREVADFLEKIRKDDKND